MFISAHLVAGLVVGKITHNYPLALASTLLVDFDHLIPYIKHKVVFNPRKFWKTVTDSSDPYGNQRNYLHSYFTWALVSLACFLIDSNLGLVISLAYFSHLFLELIDGSDFYPLYPLRYKIVGPIKYFSKQELIFTLVLFVIFLLV